MIPAQFAAIYEELNVTSEALVHDLGAILNIVEILVDFAGIDYINTGDVSFEGASEALSSVFDELFNLELIDHKFAEIIFAALEAFDIKLDVTLEELQGVNGEHELELFKQLFEELEIVLANNDLDSLSAVEE